MKRPVIAIGLDAADPVLLENWMSQGHLKTLNRLRQEGVYGRLTNMEYYKAETPWTTFLTGCMPQKTGYWGPIQLEEGTYKVEEGGSYDFAEYPPFYALGDDYRVAVFDMPQSTLSEQVNGLQVLAWGAHSPQTPSLSQPANLLPDIIRQYGEHPALHKDHGVWWRKEYATWLKEKLETGIKRRSSICRDLLRQENWNLFLTVFAETHSAGHIFWCFSQPDHPLYPYKAKDTFSGDPMLEVFEAVDRAIAEILAEAPEDVPVVVFSTHGSDNNISDLSSMLFLGEFLYRFNFPGKVMVAPGKVGTTPPPPISAPTRYGWTKEIWQRKYEANPIKRWLRRWAPGSLQRKLDRFLGYSGSSSLSEPDPKLGKLVWQPAMWYQPYWHQMKAFAIPSFSEGYIRINLQGREPAGIVSPSEYNALCDELTEVLYQLKDARTGEPVVKKVIRTRQDASDRDPKLPDADLIVMWSDRPTDVVDSPTLGRIGPVPYYRTGSHRNRGFLMAKGPGIAAGSTLPESHAVNLAPTILDLMGAPIPEYFDGKPLLKTSPVSATV